MPVIRQISAQPFTVRKTRRPGQPPESDTAQPTGHARTRRFTQAIATAEIAQAITRGGVGAPKVRAVATAAEGVEVAQVFTHAKVHDLAQTVAAAEIVLTVDLIPEPSELALPIEVIRGAHSIIEAVEGDATALPIAAVKVGGHIIDLIGQAIQGTSVAQSIVSAGPVPWAMPARSTLIASPKKVFAHWAGGTYTRGDNSTAYAAEVTDMIRAGFDGAIVDGFHWPPGNQNIARIQGLAQAATNHGGFSIVPMTDGAFAGDAAWANPATLANRLATQIMSSPSIYKIPGSSPVTYVISPWRPDVQGTVYWQQCIASLLNTYGYRVKLAPIFLAVPADLTPWAPMCHVMGSWGSAVSSTTPGSYDNESARVKASATGMGWAQPVRVQDVRSDSGFWWESSNMGAFRYHWDTAIRTGATWAHCPTWNDWPEGTNIEVTSRHQNTFIDLMAYYGARWKTGSFPPIQRDGMFITHRRHFYNATPTTPPSPPANLVGGAARDKIEVWAFATGPTALILKVNGVTQENAKMAAGAYVWTVPLYTGTLSFEMIGDFDEIFVSPFVVQSPPPTQDLQYYGLASLRM